jgi:hypothetical protein
MNLSNYFVIRKMNEFVVTSNKLADNFVALVISCRGPMWNRTMVMGEV